jgi:RNA polymerase sigma-70 factor (ECF subfamily)
MVVQGKSGSFPNHDVGKLGWTGADRAGSLVTSLDMFREYLTLIAGHELGTDLAAKVSASDIVQETFLAAGRDITQFQGLGPIELRCWLKGILQNLLANTRRHYRGTRKRHVSRELRVRGGTNDDRRDPIDAITASMTSPSGRAMKSERAAALSAVIDDLRERYRRVIQWHHQERLPFEAIAARLGVSPEAARKVWARALLRLRAALGPGHDPQ